MTNTAHFDLSLYPKSYRTAVLAGTGKPLFMACLFILAVHGRAHVGLTSPSWALIFAGTLLGLLILLFANYAFACVTLYSDRIESRTWLGKKVMRREDVAGYRLMGRYEIPSLIYKNDSDTPFPLPTGIKKDAAWDAWMAIAPNLDALDEKKILTDASAYPSLGTTEQERQCRWGIANRLASACMIGSILGLICIFIRPIQSFAALALIIIPWVALANMKLYGVHFSGSPSKTPEIGNAVALITSGMGLGAFGALYPMMTVFLPYGTLHTLFLVVGPLCGLILFIVTLIVIMSAPQMKDSLNIFVVMIFLVPLMIIFDWGYGIGAAIEINTVFDNTKPTSYAVRVLEEPVLTNATVRLKISAWSSYPETLVEPSRASMGSVALNDAVCVWSHPGFLGIPWYTVTPGKDSYVVNTQQEACKA